MQRGVIRKAFEKGFMFIKPDSGGSDIFAHVYGWRDVER
jgi:cold shock CspA family protein